MTLLLIYNCVTFLKWNRKWAGQITKSGPGLRIGGRVEESWAEVCSFGVRTKPATKQCQRQKQQQPTVGWGRGITQCFTLVSLPSTFNTSLLAHTPSLSPWAPLAQSPGWTVPRGAWPQTWRLLAAELNPRGAESWRLPADPAARCWVLGSKSTPVGVGDGVSSFHGDVYHCGTWSLEYKACLAW